MKQVLILCLVALTINAYSQTVFSSNNYQVVWKNDTLSITVAPNASFVNGFNVMGAVIDRQTIISLDTFKDVNFSNNTFLEKMVIANSSFYGHINMQHVRTERDFIVEHSKLFTIQNLVASDFFNTYFNDVTFDAQLHLDYSRFRNIIQFNNCVLPDTITCKQINSIYQIDFTKSDFSKRTKPIIVICTNADVDKIKIDNHFRISIQ